MKSASSSGPIGWFAPSFMAVSMASTDPDALVQRVDRLVDHRQQDAVDDEGREIFGHDTVLPSRGQLAEASKVSSSVAMPRISSTSCITGTGFMKCMPMNGPGGRSGASRVIEIDEVLEAIIASAQMRHQRLEDPA